MTKAIKWVTPQFHTTGDLGKFLNDEEAKGNEILFLAFEPTNSEQVKPIIRIKFDLKKEKKSKKNG